MSLINGQNIHFFIYSKWPDTNYSYLLCLSILYFGVSISDLMNHAIIINFRLEEGIKNENIPTFTKNDIGDFRMIWFKDWTRKICLWMLDIHGTWQGWHWIFKFRSHMEVYIKYEYDYLSIDFYGENKNIQKITKDFNIINFVTILRDILSWYVSVGMLVKTFLYEWILCVCLLWTMVI